jgi:hypothetical protein
VKGKNFNKSSGSLPQLILKLHEANFIINCNWG